MDLNNLSGKDAVKLVLIVLAVGGIGAGIVANGSSSNGSATKVVLEDSLGDVITVHDCREDNGIRCLFTNKTQMQISLFNVQSKGYDSKGVMKNSMSLAKKLDPKGTAEIFMGGSTINGIVEYRLVRE